MDDSSRFLSLPPQALVEHLAGRGIRRFAFTRGDRPGALRATHPELQPIADFLAADPRDFLDHEGLFFQVSRRHATLQGAFVHRTCRGQAAGGVRYWDYPTLEAYLRDGMRLAVGMTRKNALAELWWGGGKGVMARNPEVPRDDPAARADLYREYGEFMTSLRGCYVTAEDVGTNVTDMAHVFETTRFTTCIPPSLGGSGNPSVPTARGVVCGMEAALAFLEDGSAEEGRGAKEGRDVEECRGASVLAGKTIAVQGLGNVARPLVGYLLDRGVARVVAWDIDEGHVEEARRAHAGRPLEARVVAAGDRSVFETPCDVFAPCATGAILNPATIPLLRARVVCGAANNQLEDSARDDQALLGRGITYVPDFLTNRMGIVTCANEDAGYVTDDPLIESHLDAACPSSIQQTTRRVLERSRATGTPPSRVAEEMADELSLVPHPVFGHRGIAILRSLVEGGWHAEGGRHAEGSEG